ncbi:MAG: cation diffusion facilitator family transporter [Acidimicrobiales bacterium]
MSERHHEGHSLIRVTNNDVRSLLLALGLLSAFLLVEVLMAVLSNSLALFADAGHMLTDVAALGMSAWAIRLARRPPQGRWTFGLKRAEILSAAVNGVTLLAIALLIAVEAIQRLVTPRHVDGGVVLTVAVLGAVVNVLVGWILSRADRTSLNIRGAYLHIITDLFAFIATAVAGLVIVVTRWEWADAVASMFVVALMLVTSWGLLRDAGKILLQASPDNLDLTHVRGHLVDVDHVLDVHDLHAWTVTSGQTTLSAHVVVEEHCFDRGHAPQILDALQQCLIDHFDIEHATFQLEPPTHEAHEEGLHP